VNLLIKLDSYILCAYMHVSIYIHIRLVVSTLLKNMKVTWDDEIPNICQVIKFMFQTTNQIH
jgi:hypothetical protein